MTSPAWPTAAVWQHVDARQGTEGTFIDATADGPTFRGHTVALDGGQPWWVGYEIGLDDRGRARHVTVESRTAGGRSGLVLEADGHGGWTADGKALATVAGCLDVDLESSALTNAFPVRRLDLRPGQQADAPAAYVTAPDLRVERLDQHYRRLPDDDLGRARYQYVAPAFDFECVLTYDRGGLVVDYPGIAVRLS